MLLIQFGDRYLSKWKKIRKGLQHKDSNHIAANSLGFAGDTVIWRRNTLGKKHIWKKKIQCILGGRVVGSTAGYINMVTWIQVVEILSG